jgi:phage shock protein E
MDNLQELIKSGAEVIDVRSREEFEGGHVDQSINIPLNEVVTRIDEFKALKQPFIVCCLSGGRSQQAAAYMQVQGIECINGGGWQQVKGLLQRLRV